ncbi:Uncharacterized protein PECH_007115 [Penicillium ucsense]|uniref:Uncharacterized protein n=1 Tax=Penicillium ucsense TaxID=2839758 RepID=A0A8J8WHV3_9EURO|nr:Uncharacterized protein PECM_006874 [Penicillium ucsense]KAF7735137.1 Uncharacterized protein PECH_007115 [Penicillium ucsense]
MLGQTQRPAVRAIGRVRCQVKPRASRPSRFQSTSSGPSSSTSTGTGTNAALAGGLAGGATAALVGYGIYSFSGAKSFVDTNRQAKQYLEQAKQKIAEAAPEPNESYNWFKKTAKRYAVFIPGARDYVDTAFRDLDQIKEKHGDDFEKIIQDAYQELSDVSSRGSFDSDTAFSAFHVLQKHLDRLMDLAGDVSDQILDNHPQVKEKIGGSYQQLKEMGEAYGPQAKEEVNKTWNQITDVIKKGATVDAIAEVKKLIDEKKQKLQKLGDEAWQKGLEESRQQLEKNPKLKSLVEDNADALKKGNFSDLWKMIQESASSGNTEKVEKFVKDKVDQAKSHGFGDMDKWLQAIPGGSNIIPQLQSLQQVAQKKGGEAEKVLKETFEELQDLLKKRKEQVEKIADDAKEESKNETK